MDAGAAERGDGTTEDATHVVIKRREAQILGDHEPQP